MSAFKKIAKNTLAAAFAAATFSGAMAQDMTTVQCVQNLMDRDGPKTVVNVTKKDNGAYRIDMKETVNVFGTVSVRPTNIGDNLRCTQKLGVANDVTGDVRLQTLSCEQPSFDGNRQKKDFDIAFRAAADGNEAGYELYETKITLPPAPQNGIEIGMVPQTDYKNLGQPSYRFQCTISLPGLSRPL